MLFCLTSIWTYTILQRRETNFPKTRVFASIASGVISPLLTLPEMSLEATGLYLNGMKEMGPQIPFLAFASIIEGAFTHAGLNKGLQEFITHCTRYKRGNNPASYEKLKYSLQNILMSVSAHIKKLPDDQVIALETLLRLSPGDFEKTFFPEGSKENEEEKKKK